MSEQSGRRQRRRRGGRGGANRPRGEGRPEQAPATPAEGQTRPPRQDTRRSRGERRGVPPAPPGPPDSHIQRAPSAGGRARRDRADGERDGRGSRERGFRTAEVPAPQDEHSLQLGAMFREAHTALRDARKALEKRKAESGDEPEWMTEQCRAAETRFAEVATEWFDHLSKTGRKVVRR